MSASSPDRSSSAGGHSRSWLTPMVGIGLWLSSVALATLLTSGVVWWVKAINGPVAVNHNQGLWGLPEQKSAALRQVFNGRPSTVIHPRKDEIEEFLTDLTKSDEGKPSKWKAVWSGERFRNRVVKSNYVQSLDLSERRIIARQSIDEFWVEGPAQFERLKVVDIAPWAEVGLHGTPKPLDDELVVFAYGRRGYGEGEPLVFWVHGPVGDLKLTDWEFVNSGISESEHAGFYESDSRDPSAQEMFLFYRHVQEIDGLSYADREKFDQTMKLAEKCLVPKAHEDLARYLLMSRWSHRSRDDDVCRLAEQVKNPERIPGIFTLHAASRWRLGQEDRALALIAQSESLTGFRPDLSEMRARLLSNSHRDQALAEWQRLVDFDPSDVSHLSQLFQLMPNARRFEVIERIKSGSDSADLAFHFAQYNAYRLTPPMFQDLSRHVALVSPDSNEACEIEVLRLRSNGEFVAAAQLNRQAAEREADPQMKKTRWASFLMDMHSAGQVLAGFDVHPDPKAAFDTLVSGLEYGEGSVAIDELAPILAAYRKHRPDDPRLAFYEGYYAAHQQDYQQADEHFLEAEKLISQDKKATQNEGPDKGEELDAEKSDQTDLLSLICRERCKARYELGDDVELLSDYSKREEAYRVLAEKAVEYRHWAVLDRINKAYHEKDPSNPWLAQNSVRLAIANQEFQTARDQMKDMAKHEAESPVLKYFRQQLQRELVAAENPDPLRRFELSEDRSTAFVQIANELLDAQDWADFEKLCLRNPDGPDSAAVALIRLEQSWRQDSAKVVELLTPWPEKIFSTSQHLKPTWRDRLVRSLLRLERRDEAMAIAQDARQRFGEVWPMMMTCVANRDSEKIEQLFSDDDSVLEQWSYRNISGDPELRPLLFDESFADFRSRHPFRLTIDEYSPTFTLLLKQPCDISEEWLLSRLTETATEGSPQISRISATRLVVQWNQTRFLLTSVPAPYFAADRLNDPAIAKHLPDLAPETRDLFAKQQAYWQIVILGGADTEQWKTSERRCRQFTARLLNDDTIGVVSRSWTATISTVLPLDSSQSDKLSSRQPLFERDNHAVILQDRRPRPLKLDDEKREMLRAITGATPTGDPMKRIIATVQLAGEDHPWLEKFQLLEMRPQQFGEREMIAEYCGQDHSTTLPELRPGIRYIVPLDKVVDVNQD